MAILSVYRFRTAVLMAILFRCDALWNTSALADDSVISLEVYISKVSVPEQSEARLRFFHLDSDGDLFLEQDSALEVAPVHPTPFERFQKADADQNLCLSPDEVSTLVVLDEGVSLPHQIALFDVDSDGFLNYLEFLELPVEPVDIPLQFRRLDRNRNKLLEESEYLARFGEAFRQGERPAFFYRDVDGDLALSIEEFACVPEKWNPHVRSRYAVFDSNGDGVMRSDEYISPHIGKASEEAARTEAALFDMDGDGSLSLTEFSLTPHGGLGNVRLGTFLSGFPVETHSKRRMQFYSQDADGDMQLTVTERSSRPISGNRFSQGFAPFDINTDMVLDENEYLEKVRRESNGSITVLPARFHEFDANGDSRLSYEEFIEVTGTPEDAAFRRLDHDQNDLLSLTEYLSRYRTTIQHSQASLFRRKDVNNDESLSLTEFLGSPDDELPARYAAFDTDGSGSVSSDEYISPHIGKASEEAARTEAALFDMDGDGSLSLTEFSLTPHGGLGNVRLGTFLSGFPVETHSKRRMQFYSQDADGDMQLTVTERSSRPISGNRFSQGFAPFDINTDMVLDENEYLEKVRRESNGSITVLPARFHEFDANGDSRLSYEEFIEVTGTPEDAAFRRLDHDQNDLLSLTEYLSRYRTTIQHSQASLFRRKDVNNDESLSLTEFLGSPDDELPARYAAFDTDGSGSVSSDEYISPHIGKASEEAARTEAALFDIDRNDILSLKEFAMTPHGRTDAGLLIPATDSDTTRWIGWDEFFAVQPPERIHEAEVYFLRHDTNGDRSLSAEEIEGKPQTVNPIESLANEFIDSSWPRMVESDKGITSRAWTEWCRNTKLVDDSRSWWDVADQNRDGILDHREFAEAIECAFGIRRTDGIRLFSADGVLINQGFLDTIDKNRNLKISRSELSAVFTSESEVFASFANADLNQDSELDGTEISNGNVFRFDRVFEFTRGDRNNDGLLSVVEFIESAAEWEARFRIKTFEAYDSDRNNVLDFFEYSATPAANPMVSWFRTIADTNHDGKLSPGEFRTNHAYFCCLLTQHYFATYDTDSSGALEIGEFPFQIDLLSVPAEAAFAYVDLNKNGVFSIDDILTDDVDSREQAAIWKDFAVEVEEAIVVADEDSDGSLNLVEFITNRDAVLASLTGTAIVPKTTNSSPEQQTFSVRFALLLGFNAVCVVVLGWLAFRRLS
jgi:Ca2+-binding EF-hand superfamily protein